LEDAVRMISESACHRSAERNQGEQICLVSSGGGHLSELLALRPAYAGRPHFFVLNQPVPLTKDMEGRTCFIRHSERDWLFFVNLWEAWRILRRERPAVILSTGAGPAVPFALVGKLLGIRAVFVECSTQIARPSLTGRIMYRLADRFYYQWEGLKAHYPDGIYGGVLLWSS
jgi:UDP-N-acetylglucosamine:LPS N-acetylglucosamine transferase